MMVKLNENKMKLIRNLCIVSIICFTGCKVLVVNSLKNQGFYRVSRFSNTTNTTDSVIVSGHVFDLGSQNSLPYSLFIIKDSKVGCMADKCGQFQIRIKPGIYKFVFQNAANTSLITGKIKLESKTSYHFVAYLDSHFIQ
jgi:hypothetical protein